MKGTQVSQLSNQVRAGGASSLASWHSSLCSAAASAPWKARDVLIEQCPRLWLGELADVIGRRRQLLQPGAGPLQRAFNCGRGSAEHGRHLGGREVEHIPQDQHRSLPARQILQAYDER